jgi:Cu+-exporting ATPase
MVPTDRPPLTTAAPVPAGPGGTARDFDLEIDGMSCAACAARIEQRLNALPGTTATVNFATRTAHVHSDGALTPERSVALVAELGYRAAPRPAASTTGTPAEVGARRDGEERALRRRVALSASLAAPVLALAMVPALQFPYWQWVSAALATPVATWGAWPFHRMAARNLRHGLATMDTLISIGVLAAYGWSLVALLAGDAGEVGMRMRLQWAPARGHGLGDLYFEVAAGVTVAILTGRWLEARGRRRAAGALATLLDLAPREVTVLRDGIEVRVGVEALGVGDRFCVRAGEQVAADGIVEEGHAALDTSMLTGEPAPVEVGPGDEVTGATVAVEGYCIVRATRVGEETRLAQIGRLITAAQAGKARIQRLADRVSSVFVPTVVLIALTTAAFWALRGAGAAFALTAAVTVLIIACPCALGLATPLALLVGTGRGAQLGVLIRGPEALEAARRVDVAVLDKTGTLTTGEMRVTTAAVAAGADPEACWRRAGALEAASAHPVARAVADAARARLGALPPVGDVRTRPGSGVEGTVDGVRVIAARPEAWADAGLEVPAELSGALDELRAAGVTPVGVGWDGGLRAVFGVSDALRPGAAEAVRALRRLGMRTVLLSGDHARAASGIAEAVGVDEVIAGVAPEGKVDVVRRLQAAGARVAMVGDGINDAAALAAADLGIAMGSGADLALEASDLTLVRTEPAAIVDALRLARRTFTTIAQNLFWAFAYNVAALPLAAAGLLNPLIAATAMAASSLFVVGNSLRLRRFRAWTPVP